MRDAVQLWLRIAMTPLSNPRMSGVLSTLDHRRQEPSGVLHATVLQTVLFLESRIVAGLCADGDAS